MPLMSSPNFYKSDYINIVACPNFVCKLNVYSKISPIQVIYLFFLLFLDISDITVQYIST